MSKAKYVIFNPEGGLGKIIASTIIVENIKKTYPDRKIIVVTPWPEVYLNNPNVFRVFRPGHTPYFYKDYIQDRDTIVLKGEPYFQTEHLYNRQHLTKTWSEFHGLEFDETVEIQPKLFYTIAEVNRIKNNITNESGKPLLLFQTNGGMYQGNPKDYCWTRDIPHNQAQVLANELSKDYHIIHVTRPECKSLENTERLGDLDKRTLMLLPAVCQNRLLIDSCLQHAAAALSVESTVLWIGTKPNVFGYNIHKNITPAVDLYTGSNTSFIDSLFFDYDFNGNEHEYPFETEDIFMLQDVYESVVGPADGSVPLGNPKDFQEMVKKIETDVKTMSSENVELNNNQGDFKFDMTSPAPVIIGGK